MLRWVLFSWLACDTGAFFVNNHRRINHAGALRVKSPISSVVPKRRFAGSFLESATATHQETTPDKNKNIDSDKSDVTTEGSAVLDSKPLIAVGEKLPFDVKVQVLADGEGMAEGFSLVDFFVGKKVALICVPGAFTPKSSEKMLPGYIELAPQFAEKGFEIVCISVNDPFVMSSWRKSLGEGADPITFLADGPGDVSHALGLSIDTGAWGGTRMRRCSMLVVDGVVKKINAEEQGAFTELSGASYLLSQI
jgi:peroxiredoxin